MPKRGLDVSVVSETVSRLVADRLSRRALVYHLSHVAFENAEIRGVMDD